MTRIVIDGHLAFFHQNSFWINFEKFLKLSWDLTLILIISFSKIVPNFNFRAKKFTLIKNIGILFKKKFACLQKSVAYLQNLNFCAKKFLYLKILFKSFRAKKWNIIDETMQKMKFCTLVFGKLRCMYVIIYIHSP